MDDEDDNWVCQRCKHVNDDCWINCEACGHYPREPLPQKEVEGD